VKSLALFSGLGGVGKTTLTFNLAHVFARMGLRTIVLDYDPQCNISSLFLRQHALVALWERVEVGGFTVTACLDSLLAGSRSIKTPEPLPVSDDLWLLPGHLNLARFEQFFSEQWVRIKGADSESAVEGVTSLSRLAEQAAESVDADLVLIDVGPNLGPLNRSALLACDGIAFLLFPDPLGLQDLKSVGPVIHGWRRDRHERIFLEQKHSHDFLPTGYILLERHSTDGPLRVYVTWEEEIPSTFHRFVLDEKDFPEELQEPDPYQIATILFSSSLVPLARIARKPVFDLKMADGIGSAQLPVVAKSRKELETLAKALAGRLELPLPVERSSF
jgi:chromosome partitioning protein